MFIREYKIMVIDNVYGHLCVTPSDINEHLPTLKRYAEEVEHVTEMGVRWIVSTWAFLSGKPKKLISIDIKHPNKFGANLSVVEKAAKESNIDFSFIEGSTLEMQIEKTDLLFIDTLHTYTQLTKELELHSKNVNRYIALHDTTTFSLKDEQPQQSSKVGLKLAISEFLEKNKDWKMIEEYINNNGLTILERK